MTLFEQACRASCEANGKDPDQRIPNPYGEGPHADPLKNDSLKPRWQWVAEICGKEIRAVIAVVLKDDLFNRALGWPECRQWLNDIARENGIEL